MSERPIEQCQHCGLSHPAQNLEDIAKFCMAVKKVETTGYIYDHGSVVSHPFVKSIEYFGPEEQRRIFNGNNR